MSITSDYIRNAQQKVLAERRAYAEQFLQSQPPNLDRIRELLDDQIEQSPDKWSYKVHVLTMGVEELCAFRMPRAEAFGYMQRAYIVKYSDWFDLHTPGAHLEFEVVGEKYLEAYIVFTLYE